MNKESPRGSEGNGISLEELSKPENSHLKKAYLEYGSLVSDEQRDGAPKYNRAELIETMFKGIEPAVVDSIMTRVHDHSAVGLHDAGFGPEIADGNEYGYEGERVEIDQMPERSDDGKRNAA